jgi:ubiquinone/menaquinone biosynthesis C-methylase UbiE
MIVAGQQKDVSTTYTLIGEKKLPLHSKDVLMKTSRSFDRAASYYDQTRTLPEPIGKQGMQAILDIAGPTARILEVGAGTGRISIPLLERGLNLIGCDLSSKMLRRLQEKSPSARIAQSDAALLPFPAASFDIVLTAHVLHLIPPWRDALREFRRVLMPGGAFLNVSTWAPVGVSSTVKIREFWRGWISAKGVDAGHPGARTQEELLQGLRSLGADITEVEAIRFAYSFNLREELERFESRVYSETWEIPDALFDASIKELRVWATDEFGTLDQQIEDQVRFVINVARFGNEMRGLAQ